VDDDGLNDDRPRPAAIQVVAASRRGTSHLRSGTDRQDRALVLRLGDAVVAVVADGLGSSRHPEIGAEEATLAVLDFLTAVVCGADHRACSEEPPADQQVPRFSAAPPTCDVDWPTLLRCAAAAACRQVRELPRARGIGSVGDYATTLTIVAIVDDRVHVAQIGDGFTVVWERGAAEHSMLLAYPGPDLESPGTVTAVTSSGVLRTMLVASAPFGPETSVLLSTDGIGPILFDLWAPVTISPRFLDALAREQCTPDFDDAELAAFLDSDMVCERTDDDKSVILVRAAAPVAEPYRADDPPTTPLPVVPRPDSNDAAAAMIEPDNRTLAASPPAGASGEVTVELAAAGGGEPGVLDPAR
jgi:hypothetical protein